MPTRRDFLERSALAAAGLALPRSAHATPASPTVGAATFVDLIRPPDFVTAQTADGYLSLRSARSGSWEADRIRVTTAVTGDALRVSLAAPGTGIQRLHLRWRGRLSADSRILGDAWERAYGDLEWRGFVPDRVMPWYVATIDGGATHCYGVRTGAAAFCAWQVDADGLSLWVDVRAGGVPLQLGARTLTCCDVLARQGRAGETPFAALHAFCRQMCPRPLLPAAPMYGANDWYYAYGDSSAEKIQVETGLIVELSPTGGNRPFSVIDDGWQPERSASGKGVGLWDRGNKKFGDMAALATGIRGAGARPGIWVRPLLATDDAPDSWRLSRDKSVMDPTVDGVLEKVAADMTRLRGWGYELIKHDYSTWDILGRWGFQMGASLTKAGWTFAAGPTHSTAEVINRFYATIARSVGDALVIGCNTVSHLSAGQFALCRIGDDTSGTEWTRTRRMGVNTLAFRAVQHGAFYAADPDGVGVTAKIPWALNRPGLELLGGSGTMLFASLAPEAVGAEQRRDLKVALARAAVEQPLGEPLDWQETTWPRRWKLGGRERQFDWIEPEGVAEIG